MEADGQRQQAESALEATHRTPPLHPPPSSSQVQRELLLARMEADGQRLRAERSERAAEGAAAGGQLVALSRLHQSEMEGASAAAAAREAALEVRKGGQCCGSSKAGAASRGEGRAVAGAAGGQLGALSRLGTSFPHPANPLCMAAPAPSLHWTAVNTWRPTCMAISHNFASPVMIP